MPPSPRLSERVMNITYLSVTVMVSAQKISERMPSRLSGDTATACGPLKTPSWCRAGWFRYRRTPHPWLPRRGRRGVALKRRQSCCSAPFNNYRRIANCSSRRQIRAWDIVGRSSLSDNARLAQHVFECCHIPGRGDGIGRRSGLKHRRRKAWGFDFPPRHQDEVSVEANAGLIGVRRSDCTKAPEFRITLGHRGMCSVGREGMS